MHTHPGPLLAAPRTGRDWLLPLLASLVTGSLFVLISQETLAWVILALLALMCVATAFLYGDLKRLLLFVFLFTLSIDISKALIAEGGIYTPGLSLYLSDIPLLGLAAINLGEMLFVTRRLPRFTRLDWIACGYVAWLWLTATYSQVPLNGAMSSLSYSKYLLAYFTLSRMVRSYAEVRLAMLAIFAAFCMQFLYVCAQFLSGSSLELQGAKTTTLGTRLIFDMAEGASAFRPGGFLHHPNVLADYLCFLLPPAFALALLGRRWVPNKVWFGALFMLLGGGAMLVLTLSRGGWISFGVAALLIIAIGMRKGLIGQIHITVGIAAALAAVAVVAIAYPQAILRLTQSDLRSTESRLVMASQAALIIRSNPVLGVGFGGYNRAAQTYIPESFSYVSKYFQEELQKGIVHNFYLLTAAEVGIPATLYWLFLMSCFIRQALPLKRWRSPATFALAIGLAAGLVAQMAFHVFDHFYADVRIEMLWCFAALLTAMRRIEARHSPALRPTPA